MMARVLPLLALLLADAALAQDCSTAEMMNVQDVVATCCESADGGDCGTVFPATCSHSCARLVVPYIDSCGTILRVMPDEAFPGLHIAGCATSQAHLPICPCDALALAPDARPLVNLGYRSSHPSQQLERKIIYT